MEEREEKFTRGIWNWWTANSWKRMYASQGREQVEVLMPDIASDNHPILKVKEADMALISQAPEMYDTLKLVRDTMKNISMWSNIYGNQRELMESQVEVIDNVLKAARGQQ